MRRAFLTGALLIGYAWVTAGVAPFSTYSYVLVAVPSVALVVTFGAWGGLSPHRQAVDAYFRETSSGATLSSVAPWIALLCAAVILEAVGLMLGGRSTIVPTLSTTVDHLLAFRWERCLLCLAWLLTGLAPLVGLRRFIRASDP